MNDLAPLPTSVQGVLDEVAASAQASRQPLPLIPALQPPEPFPIKALGGLLAGAADTIQSATQAPDALAGQSVLAAAALAVQGHYDVQHPLGHVTPSSLLFISSAESGERKSTVDGLALRAFREAESAKHREYKRDFAEWRASMDAREAKKSHIKAKRGTGNRGWKEIAADLADLGPDPSPPLSPTRIVADPNFEGLVKFASSAHGSLGWFNNEAGQSIGGTALHDENRLKFGAGLSRFWDGQEIDRVRAGDGAQSLRGRRLTVHLMLQPAIAAPFLADPLLRAQGWLSRALICEPSSTIGRRPWKEPPEICGALAAYERRVAELMEMPCPHAEEAANILCPRPLPWSTAARALWISFHDTIEKELIHGGRLEGHRGFGAKLAENTARIATVLAGFAGRDTIDDETMYRAITLADFYVGETVRQREAACIAGELMLAEKTRALFCNSTRWVREEVSLRELMQYAPAAARVKKMSERIVAILREYGWFEGPPAGPWIIRGRS